jgi:hypothetical protein
MQISYLHRNILALHRLVIPEKSKTEFEKLCEETVKKWELLRKDKVSPKGIQKILGISRATYYRRKKFLSEKIFKSKKPKNLRQSEFGDEFRQKIFAVRKENPTYGKQKIAVILKRDFKMQISESSVGRILKTMNFPKSASALRVKKSRKFDKHAKPHKFKKYEDAKVGENVQIDHMTVRANGRTFKQFTAIEHHSKSAFVDVFTNATSETAGKFLEDFIENAPFEILSFQVDGGSEFMGEFEEVCRKHDIPLFVLPPATPKYNGVVERSNRTFKEEFYHNPAMKEDSIVGVKRELKKYAKKYNEYRPHASLQGLTPKEYLDLPEEKRPPLIVYKKRKRVKEVETVK